MTIDIKNKALPEFSKDFIQMFQPAINNPYYSAGQISNVVEGLTSKNLHDWAKKNLHVGTRDPKEGGWNRFSIVAAVELLITTDLRKLGIPLPTISTILHPLSTSNVTATIKKSKTAPTSQTTLREIDYGILSCFKRKKIQVAILFSERIQTAFLTELDFIEYYNNSLGASAPIIVLPLFKYVRLIMDKIKDGALDNTEQAPARILADNRLSEQIKTIIDIIQNKQYNELSLKRKNGDAIILNAKTQINGSLTEADLINTIHKNDFQKVTANVVGGKIINIISEESILI